MDKIGYGHLCLRDENKVTKPPWTTLTTVTYL